MMKRTQIYIPHEIHRRVAREAKRRKCSMAKLLRESIEKDYGIIPKEGNAQVLIKMIENAEELDNKYPLPPGGPKDLAENHDYYLYGKGRIE